MMSSTDLDSSTTAPSSGVETLAAPFALSGGGGLDQTLAAGSASLDPGVPLDGTLVGRTTVLPRVVGEGAGMLRLEPNPRSRYSSQRRLGAGAMGEVELSEDHDIGRKVALKRLPAGNDSPALVARFVDEVRTMGSLDHPNITPIYDVGRDEDGRLFFTMKYVEGESLEALIERLKAGDPRTHAQFPIARRLDVFVGIVHALDYAHAQGILHRDIKPANVMVQGGGPTTVAVLCDFGIARLLDADDERLTAAGSLVGTPH
ncbi:MAG: serine/threonine protein kinase, partial [Myxococcales bacterium]|nr:serine/threonine protein kinase [Myxococcales bacterium]